MTFDEVLSQAQDLLQREQRVSYRGLKRRFALDDEYLEDLKEELIGAQRLATDEDGRFLVWTGSTTVVSSQLSVVSPQPPTPSPQPPAERRQLTVMFCDLVGSTALSEQLDPEELRDVVRAYQQTSAVVIERYDGHIAQYLGDGVLAYFGYPLAHEDDAQRAVCAGLGIIEALQRLNAPRLSTVGAIGRSPLPNPQLPSPLQVRIGIHTGPVVVGEMGSGAKREHLALGETPNIAARLQGSAEPDTVVISTATQRLVAGLFECQDLGPQTLKGISIPLSVYRVSGEGTARNRFEVAVNTGLTPLGGREEELGLLQRRWTQAQEGAGQVVLLSGEPGIGKSRLVQALKDQLGQGEATRIEFRCSPYHQNSAFYPILEHLQRLLQFHRAEPPQAKLAKLQHALSRYRFPQADTVSLLAALLSLPHPEGCAPILLSPQKQKQKTQEALVAWIIEEAEKAAVYCAWEDLHWADPSTLEVLTLFLEQIPTTRVFAVLTFRPDFAPPWIPHSQVTQLTLSRLARTQTEAMIERVTGSKALPAEVVRQIVSKTDGVPLFVEELTKMVLEAGLHVGAMHASPLPPLAIPATLQDALMARLDRLAPGKEVVQLGATLGREFSYEVLQAVSAFDEVTLQRELARLVTAEFLSQWGLPPHAQYVFKHALVQDAAYQSLLKSKRQQYHQKIGQVLEERFAEIRETQPELLAHHYTEAGLLSQALPYWQKAGERATQRSANIEAMNHLTKGLELLTTLPTTPECVQQELGLQISLGTPLIMTKGYAAPEVERCYARARDLCHQLGETPQLFPVIFGLFLFYLTRARYKLAHELAAQLLRLAQREQEGTFLVEAHWAAGLALLYLGEIVPAEAHLKEVIFRYLPQQPNPYLVLYGQDPRVASLAHGTWPLWLLGYPDQALKRGQEALTFARELSHPFSLAFALHFVALIHQFRREGQSAQTWAEEALRFAGEQEFPFWLAMAMIIRGGELAEQGPDQEGIMLIRQGLVTHRTLGADIGSTYWLALLAERYSKRGQVAEGLAVLAETFELVNENGERWWEAELYRLKGELLLAQGGGKKDSSETPLTGGLEAEQCFHQAIAISRRQSAKSLELRATVSLSRLWQKQNKKEEAHERLAEIYGWFTEGFDTKDLQEAKILIEELS